MLQQQEALYFKAGTDPEAGLWGGGPSLSLSYENCS